jgi:hypothetical protein
MTTLREAREAIYKRFVDEWVSSGTTPLTPYTFDNEVFDPPKGTDGRGTPWARCSVRNLDAGQQTLGRAGHRKFYRIGLARVEIFVPPGSGRWDTDTYMMKAQLLFEGRVTPPGTNIRFFEVTPQEIGLIEDGRWDLSTVEARFDYEEIK